MLRAEGFADLGHLGPLQMADIGGEFLQASAHDGERRQVGGVVVAGDHLGGDRGDPQPQFGERHLLHPRIDGGMGADRPRQLADPDVLPGGDDALAFPVEFIEPAGQDEAEADRLGVDPMGSAGHQGGALLDRPPADHCRQPIDII